MTRLILRGLRVVQYLDIINLLVNGQSHGLRIQNINTCSHGHDILAVYYRF